MNEQLIRLEEKHLALTAALAQHEKICGDRYTLLMRVVIGTASATIAGLGAIALMLFTKII